MSANTSWHFAFIEAIKENASAKAPDRSIVNEFLPVSSQVRVVVRRSWIIEGPCIVQPEQRDEGGNWNHAVRRDHVLQRRNISNVVHDQHVVIVGLPRGCCRQQDIGSIRYHRARYS